MLNSALIEATSEKITRKIIDDNKPKPEESITDCFGFDYGLSGKPIGKLRFQWIVKEIEGKPNHEFLYLLTKCKVCGQTNPTGITIPREIIWNGNIHNVISYHKNTWNCYTLDDLIKLGLKVAKWDKNSLKKYMAQRISIPIKNDVKKLKIHKCKTTCNNCGFLINYSASDCFI